MMKIEILNGKSITYFDDGDKQFKVQVGEGRGSYSTRYSFPDLFSAVKYFNGINIGNGYKKRLINYRLNKPVLVRQFS